VVSHTSGLIEIRNKVNQRTACARHSSRDLGISFRRNRGLSNVSGNDYASTEMFTQLGRGFFRTGLEPCTMFIKRFGYGICSGIHIPYEQEWKLGYSELVGMEYDKESVPCVSIIRYINIFDISLIQIRLYIG